MNYTLLMSTFYISCYGCFCVGFIGVNHGLHPVCFSKYQSSCFYSLYLINLPYYKCPSYKTDGKTYSLPFRHDKTYSNEHPIYKI